MNVQEAIEELQLQARVHGREMRVVNADDEDLEFVNFDDIDGEPAVILEFDES